MFIQFSFPEEPNKSVLLRAILQNNSPQQGKQLLERQQQQLKQPKSRTNQNGRYIVAIDPCESIEVLHAVPDRLREG